MVKVMKVNLAEENVKVLEHIDHHKDRCYLKVIGLMIILFPIYDMIFLFYIYF